MWRLALHAGSGTNFRADLPPDAWLDKCEARDWSFTTATRLPTQTLVLNPTVAPTPHWFVCYQMEIDPMGCDESDHVVGSYQNTVYFWKVKNRVRQELLFSQLVSNTV